MVDLPYDITTCVLCVCVCLSVCICTAHSTYVVYVYTCVYVTVISYHTCPLVVENKCDWKQRSHNSDPFNLLNLMCIPDLCAKYLILLPTEIT